jgi:protease I
MMELTGKKAAILIEDLFNELELYYPFYRLKEAGARVALVGSSAPHTYKGKSGLTATSELSAVDAVLDDFDALMIPGGYAPDHMRRHQAMVELVKKADQQKKTLAAICHAGWMLASAKVCSGRKMTSFYAIKDDLIHAGANWVDEEVVVDRNMVTSRTPDDLPAFMRAVIQNMSANNS